MVNNSSEQMNDNFETKRITGLAIIDSKIKNLSIEGDFFCEYRKYRSYGSLKFVKLKNAQSGLIDFSNISIENFDIIC